MKLYLSSTQSLEFVLGEAATTELGWTASYVDIADDPVTFAPATVYGVSNDTTDVILVPSPTSPDVRQVKGLSIKNGDGIDHIITVMLDDGGNETIVKTITITDGQTLYYADDVGWYVDNLPPLFQPLDSTLTAVAAWASTGMISMIGADTFAFRTITGTAAEITVADGDGVAAAPTISIPTAVTFTGKTITGGTFSGVTLSGTTTLPGGSAINTAGTLTIAANDGGAPPMGLLLTDGGIATDDNVNGEHAINAQNASTGTGAYCRLHLQNSANSADVGILSTGYTPSGMLLAGGMFIRNSGAGGISVFTTAAQPVYIGHNSTEIFRTSATGLTFASNMALTFAGTGAATTRTNLGLAIGSDVQAYDADLAALAANSTDGLWAHTGAGTGSARTITGTASQITVSNGDGVSGNPTLSLDADVVTADICLIIDGGGSAITTGIKGYLEIPFACTINRVTMAADQSGSIVVDIWKDTYANYPPTDADSITASAVPTISATTKSQDSTLTGWTTSITAGDVLGFNVDSASTVTRVTISLKVTKA